MPFHALDCGNKSVQKHIDISEHKGQNHSGMKDSYGKPNQKKPPIKAILAALAVIIVVIVGGLMLETSVTHSSICANTASREGYVERLGGRTTDEWSTPSALDTYLRGKDVPVVHRWIAYQGTGRNIFGGARSHRHGDPGAIMNMRDEVLERWIATHTHEEIVALYETLKRDNQDEITAKIAEIYEVYYEGQTGG